MALQVADRYGGEIVSVDSMQVYRGMDIGTAKASRAMQELVPHHLLDMLEPNCEMSVAEFQREGKRVLDDLEARGVVPVICGGSGLHFRALVDPLEFPARDESIRAELETRTPAEARARLETIDATAGEHVDLANPRRVVRALEIERITGRSPSERAATTVAAAVRAYHPAREFVAIGLDPGAELADRVVGRFDQMLADGLLDEVAGLRARLGRLSVQAVGYKELLPVVDGEQDLAQGRTAAIRATMALAKRQRTFFRRDPRIHWITWDPDPAVRLRTVINYLDGISSWSL